MSENEALTEITNQRHCDGGRCILTKADAPAAHSKAEAFVATREAVKSTFFGEDLV